MTTRGSAMSEAATRGPATMGLAMSEPARWRLVLTKVIRTPRARV
jgi:hypothetical protein